MNILIVEDSKLYNKVFKEWLGEIGTFNITSVKTGENAINSFKDNDFQIIILDVELQGEVNGIEVCRKIREIDETNKVNILIITSHTDNNMREFAFSAGADEFIIKPVNKDIFIRLVKKLYENVINKKFGKALVIDDSSTMLLLIRMTLKTLGFNVDLFKSWEEAKPYYESYNYDLIILDIILPNITGVDILKIIRKDEKNKLTPIIGITSQKDVNILRSFFANGGTDFLTKPIIIEEMISRINAHLKLSQINKELETGKLELSELLKIRQKNFEVIVHQLRTPLSTIFTVSDILKTKYSDDKNIIELSNILNAHSVELLNEVNKILEISKIETSQLNVDIEKINLKEIVYKIIKRLQILLDTKKLKIELKNIDIEFKADKQHVKTIMENLISNAIKYSYEGKIEIGASKENDDIVKIYVKDEGIGITEKDKDLVFNEYTRVNQYNDDIQGTGIGLSIVKKLIEAHNGLVWVESDGENKGSTFYINLPIL